MSVETRPPKSEARFAAVGDIFLGDQPVCLGFGVRSLAERAGYASFFQDVKDTLGQYQLVVANLETIISSRDAVVSSGSAARVDRADPEAAGAISDAGIRLVGLANNHIFEYACRFDRITLYNISVNNNIDIFLQGFSSNIGIIRNYFRKTPN